ncbi:MAG: hypothetical protein RLZZ29_841 [Cyanobacteriota bacterium]|jgi:hypothetical protein
MKTLPSWLSAKNLYIAENLINQGFHYCGDSDDFSIGYFVEGLENWDLYFCYGEIGLDAICDQALFCLDLEIAEISPDDVVEHTKKLISLFSHQWDHESANHNQLSLFAA